MKAAVIDIGSNSVRFAKGEVERGRAKLEPKRLVTTRLATGLTATGALCEDAMQRSISALAGFAKEACDLPLYAYATSAVRDAANRKEFLERAHIDTGVRIRVLTGAEEAEFAFLGAASGRSGLVDIGGGSAQVVTKTMQKSFPIGCVRAKEYAAGAAALDGMREAVHNKCRDLMALPVCKGEFSGVGGTITTLAALLLGLTKYDRTAVEGCRLSLDALRDLIRTLYDMGEGRRLHPLLTERHDVIICGALIAEYMMREIRLEALIASDRDGMEGYLEHVAANAQG